MSSPPNLDVTVQLGQLAYAGRALEGTELRRDRVSGVWIQIEADPDRSLVGRMRRTMRFFRFGATSRRTTAMMLLTVGAGLLCGGAVVYVLNLRGQAAGAESLSRHAAVAQVLAPIGPSEETQPSPTDTEPAPLQMSDATFRPAHNTSELPLSDSALPIAAAASEPQLAVVASADSTQKAESKPDAPKKMATAPVSMARPTPSPKASPLPAKPATQVQAKSTAQEERVVSLAPIGGNEPNSSDGRGPVAKQIAKAKSMDEPDTGVIFNEAAPRKAVPSQAATPSRKTRLIAISDGTTIIVPDKETGVPRPIKVGQALPDGSKLLAVDIQAGTAKTDSGLLKLE